MAAQNPVSTSYGAKTEPGTRTVANSFMAIMFLGIAVYVAFTGTSVFTGTISLAILGVIAIGLGDITMVPRKYLLTPQGITIEKSWWKATIPMDSITRVEAVDSHNIHFRIPLVPAGWRGFSGAYGKFLVSVGQDKEVWSFNSNRNEKFVVIHTLKGIYAISPEPASKFVANAQDMVRIRRLGRSQ